MKRCVESSTGKPVRELVNIDISPEENLTEIHAILDDTWDKCGKPQEIFVLSDIKGASPFNGLIGWLKEKRIKYRGITGVNLPMIVCTVNHRALSLNSLFEKVLEAKEKGIEIF